MLYAPHVQATHVDTVPFYSNGETRCRCGATRDIYVILRRNCAELGGDERYQRACQGCGRRWVEQAREMPTPPSA